MPPCSGGRKDRLAALGASVVMHLGLDPQETGDVLRTLLGEPEDGGHVGFLSGPFPGGSWMTRRVFQFFDLNNH